VRPISGIKPLLSVFKYRGKGFTLIELMVAIAILGLLAAVAALNPGQ